MAKKDFSTMVDVAQEQTSLVKENMNNKPKGLNINRSQQETLSHKQMILIKPSMFEKIDAEAKRNGVSFNYVVNMALNELIEKYGL